MDWYIYGQEKGSDKTELLFRIAVDQADQKDIDEIVKDQEDQGVTNIRVEKK